MIYLDLIFNLSLLVSLSIVSSFIGKRWERNTGLGVLLQGILFGCTAVLGMLRPLNLEPGLIFDGRSVLLSLCAFFFGPWAAATASMMAIICRIWLGGSGMITGVMVIIITAGIGLLTRFRFNPEIEIPSGPGLYFFGMVVHIVMLATMFTLYEGDGLSVVKRIGLPVILLYPLATILAGKILSDQIETEHAMTASEASEKRLIEAHHIAKLGYFTWDVVTNEVSLSDALLVLLKYDQSGKIDYTSLQTKIHHPDDAERITAWLNDCIASGMKNLTPNEYRLIRKDGETIYVRAVGIIERGNSVKVFATVQDITEQKRSEKALRESEEKYRKLFELESDAIFLIEKDTGKILEVNASATDIYGFSREELLTMKNTDLSAEPSQTKKATKDCFTKIPVRYHRKKNGTVFPVEITASHLNWNGRQAHIAAIRDISFRVEAESMQDLLEKELYQARKMESIGMLAGGIAHDFNNILSSIIGFTELALDDVNKGSLIEDNLREVLGAGSRAKDLVKQILAFARQSEEENKPIQFSMIAKEVLKLIRSSLPTTIEIKENIGSDSLIMGNSTNIHQILLNLCTNAAYAMEEHGGTLELSLKDIIIGSEDGIKIRGLTPGNYIEIKVSDTGVGIPPDIIGSIFEPYFTTKPMGEGTGMGLAMVHGIVVGYDGKITVESKLGKGSTFTIYLPVIKKRAFSCLNKSEDVPKGKERILFVDDEASIARMCGQILERLGYQVTTRTSSVEALALFRVKANDFDLVITDMTMPNMTGDKLAVELMKIRPNIPVILFTGYSKKISDEIAAQIGIKGFAYKPVVKNDLAKMIRKVMDEASPKTLNENLSNCI